MCQTRKDNQKIWQNLESLQKKEQRTLRPSKSTTNRNGLDSAYVVMNAMFLHVWYVNTSLCIALVAYASTALKEVPLVAPEHGASTMHFEKEH